LTLLASLALRSIYHNLGLFFFISSKDYSIGGSFFSELASLGLSLTALLLVSSLLLELSLLLLLEFLQSKLSAANSLGLEQLNSAVCRFLLACDRLVPFISGNTFILIFNDVEAQILIDFVLFIFELNADLSHFLGLINHV